jgi:hypothetical protein
MDPSTLTDGTAVRVPFRGVTLMTPCAHGAFPYKSSVRRLLGGESGPVSGCWIVVVDY